jgi:hypothetical protein
LITGSPGANITVNKKNGANACGTSPTTITNGSTYISSGESICLQLNSTSAATLSTSTNSLPVLNLRTTDWTSAGAHGSDVGNVIPLMIRGP